MKTGQYEFTFERCSILFTFQLLGRHGKKTTRGHEVLFGVLGAIWTPFWFIVGMILSIWIDFIRTWHILLHVAAPVEKGFNYFSIVWFRKSDDMTVSFFMRFGHHLGPYAMHLGSQKGTLELSWRWDYFTLVCIALSHTWGKLSYWGWRHVLLWCPVNPVGVVMCGLVVAQALVNLLVSVTI